MKKQLIDYFYIDENDDSVCYCEICHTRYRTKWNLSFHLETKHGIIVK